MEWNGMEQKQFKTWKQTQKNHTAQKSLQRPCISWMIFHVVIRAMTLASK